MINVLFVSPDQSMVCSGVSTVVSQLADHLVKECDNFNVRIITVGSTAVDQDSRVKIDFINPLEFGGRWSLLFRIYREIVRVIKEHNISLVHVHGVWRVTNYLGIVASIKYNVPVILSSHGMLEQWLWKKQGFINEYKKKIYFNLIFKKRILHNVVLHAITDREKENLRTYFPDNRIELVPNSINMELENKLIGINRVDDVKKTIVFLGRLHPVKGIELLLKAYCKANLPEIWKVLVIGPEEDPGYLNQLKKIVRENNIDDRVQFLGPVFNNEEKFQLLRQAWILVAPSYSEVMGMVNLEAALCNTPSITTFETGLYDWEKGGGVLIHPEINQLAQALLKVTRWTNKERREKGRQSFNLVKENYSWQATLPQWIKCYMGMTVDNDAGKILNEIEF